MKNKNTNKNRALLKYAGLGTQWIIILLIAVGGGIALDKKTGISFPIFTVTLPLLALVYNLYALIKSLSKKDD